MASEGWSTLLPYVIHRVIDVYKRTNYWRVAGPRLRLVNKHWKSAVDDMGFHLSTADLSAFPLCRQLASLLRRFRVTSLAVYPQYRQTFELTPRVAHSQLCAVRRLSMVDVDIGNSTFQRFLSLSATLRQLTLFNALMDASEMQLLAQFTFLTALQLCEVRPRREVSFEIDALTNLTQLRALSIVDCRGFVRDVTIFRALTALEFAEVMLKFAFVLRGLDAVSQCSRMTSLALVTNPDPYFLYRLDFVCEMTALTSLAVPPSAKVPLSRLPPLKRLALVPELWTQIETALIETPDDDARLPYEESLSLDLPYLLQKSRNPAAWSSDALLKLRIRSLTSLDIPGHPVSHAEMAVLASMRDLRELRMHLGTEPRFFAEPEIGFVFARLELWTVNIDWRHAGDFAARAMPALEALGVFVNHPVAVHHCLSQLPRIQRLKRLNFVGAPPVRGSFWTRFYSCLSRCRVLRQVGWRRLSTASPPIPSSTEHALTRRGIALDDDYSVFLNRPLM